MLGEIILVFVIVILSVGGVVTYKSEVSRETTLRDKVVRLLENYEGD